MSSSIKNDPLLSVIMPIYNGESYLAEAIESILIQTYHKFELILIDDGSTDNSAAIIKEYLNKDKRMRLINIEKNNGISGAMNQGIREAQGEYIVRADADDICLPQRFQAQLDFMDKHPTIGVAGTYYWTFLDRESETCIPHKYEEINIFKGMPPVNHPTCIVRRYLFEKYGYYDSRFDNAEDFELWFRWYSQGVRFMNQPQYFYKKRVHSGSVSVARLQSQTNLMLKVNILALTKYHIPFTWEGYKRIVELFTYGLYLRFGLNRFFSK